MISEVRGDKPAPKSEESLKGVRGGDYHALRFTPFVCRVTLPMNRFFSAVREKP